MVSVLLYAADDAKPKLSPEDAMVHKTLADAGYTQAAANFKSTREFLQQDQSKQNTSDIPWRDLQFVKDSEVDLFVKRYKESLTDTFNGFTKDDEEVLRKHLKTLNADRFKNYVATRKYIRAFNANPDTKVPKRYDHIYLRKDEAKRIAEHAKKSFLDALKDFDK